MATKRPFTRVKGKPAIERSLLGLLVRINRYGMARAVAPEDRAWAAKASSQLAEVAASWRESDRRGTAP